MLSITSAMFLDVSGRGREFQRRTILEIKCDVVEVRADV